MRYIKAHEEHATTPLTISPMHHAWTAKILVDLLDGEHVGDKTFCIHQDKSIEYYPDYDAWHNGSKKLLEKIKNDRALVTKVNQESEKLIDKIIILIRDFARQDISSCSNQQIADFLIQTFNLGRDLSAYGYVPVFSDHFFHRFTHLLKEIIKKQVVNSDLNDPIPEIMHLLSSPNKVFPSKQARKELLELLDQEGMEAEKLKNHYLDWYWVDYGQLGPKLEYSEFLKSATQLSADKNKVRTELQEINKQIDELPKKQERVAEQLNLSEQERYFFSVAKDFMYLKALRMEVLFGVSACWGDILVEVSKRFKIDKNLLYYCSVHEIADWLIKDQPMDLTELKERSQYCIWIAHDENRAEVLIGQTAQNFLKEIKTIQDQEAEDVLNIHGTVASTGYAQGRVKIVNKAEEIYKVEPGDILVSVATHPALLPAMKKAVGFITDSGGLTCHAAIVAREMQKPCIIGTKIATKVLKDGDLVELDTKKGDIRRI
ncbi:MAG: PEP-utilizing enzyme [bacterium]